MLFGDDWLNLNGKFIEGAAVCVTGKMQARFRDSQQKEFKVTNVELLQTVKEKAIDRITIQLTTDMLNDAIVADLTEIIREHPGKTKLFFQLRDSVGKHHVLLQSRNSSVDVRYQLINYIDNHEAIDYKIN